MLMHACVTDEHARRALRTRRPRVRWWATPVNLSAKPLNMAKPCTGITHMHAGDSLDNHAKYLLGRT
jgi:hypothetical protein